MPPEERAQRVAELFKSAVEQPTRDRAAFLESACSAEPEIRAEVESLLRVQERANGFMDRAAAEIAAEEFLQRGAFAPGEAIGSYTIDSLIGKGGMGEVYLAHDRELHRRVALKLVRRGMDTEAIVRRFRHEQQLLAGLNHPNIAQLYGTGVTPGGIPFFAMEFVEGEPLHEFVQQRALGTRERLLLFRKICAAVAYAHQHLVVHRDLKPANIRVTPEGEPKLLDFGIAKLLDAIATDAPEQTITIGPVMTPEYASPEQIRGERVTTASDIYSLGVVLYELLTGAKPYRLTSHHVQEITRAIAEQEPQRPSTRDRSLRGDLDNIVLMALRKEPQRRYSSVAQFSDDIQRHLIGRTVLARRDTFSYRASKFVRRNKAAVAAAVLLVLTLAGGIIATARQAQRAQRRFDEVRRLANSLMFEIHDSVQHLQGATPTRRLIVDRALQYLDSLNAEGGGDTSLQRELATAYEKVGDIQGNPYNANLGDTDGALTSYRKATAIREAVARREPSTQAQLELGRSYRGLGDVMEQKGDLAECLRNYRHSLSIFEQLATASPGNREVQDELARAYDTLGDGLGRTSETGERLRVYNEALAIRTQLLAANPSDTKTRRGIAVALAKIARISGNQPGEAVETMKRSVAMFEALAADDPQNARALREVGFAYYQLGRIQRETGDHHGSIPSRQKALEIREKVAAQDPQNQQAQFDLAVGHGELAESYNLTHAPAEALPHAQKSIELLNALVTGDPKNAVYRRNLALACERLGDAHAASAAGPSARQAYEQALAIFSALRDEGALMPADAAQFDTFSQKIAALSAPQ